MQPNESTQITPSPYDSGTIAQNTLLTQIGINSREGGQKNIVEPCKLSATLAALETYAPSSTRSKMFLSFLPASKAKPNGYTRSRVSHTLAHEARLTFSAHLRSQPMADTIARSLLAFTGCRRASRGLPVPFYFFIYFLLHVGFRHFLLPTELYLTCQGHVRPCPWSSPHIHYSYHICSACVPWAAATCFGHYLANRRIVAGHQSLSLESATLLCRTAWGRGGLCIDALHIHAVMIALDHAVIHHRLRFNKMRLAQVFNLYLICNLVSCFLVHVFYYLEKDVDLMTKYMYIP